MDIAFIVIVVVANVIRAIVVNAIFFLLTRPLGLSELWFRLWFSLRRL